jgi:hypothetical protein
VATGFEPPTLGCRGQCSTSALFAELKSALPYDVIFASLMSDKTYDIARGEGKYQGTLTEGEGSAQLNSLLI